MNFSTNSSTDIIQSTNSERQPLNPLLLTSSSENISKSQHEEKAGSDETFCSKFESTNVRKVSSDLFSAAPSSNLNDLINILSNKVSNVCLENDNKNLDSSEIISTAHQAPSDLFSSPGFAQSIKNDDDVICLSSDNQTTDSEEVIEVSSDEYDKVEARINFMTSSVETRVSSASTLGRKSRMERFLKDVSQNFKSLNLEDDFKMKRNEFEKKEGETMNDE